MHLPISPFFLKRLHFHIFIMSYNKKCALSYFSSLAEKSVVSYFLILCKKNCVHFHISFMFGICPCYAEKSVHFHTISYYKKSALFQERILYKQSNLVNSITGHTKLKKKLSDTITIAYKTNNSRRCLSNVK